VAECIDEIGIGFLYAINHHPAMRYAIGPRREIGQRTVFNLLGPLTNPAGATHQLIGIYDGELTATIAEVLGTLGTRAAFIVYGADGLDELSTTGVNKISRLDGGSVTTFELDPTKLGIPKATLADLLGNTPQENAQITYNILSGKDRGPRRDIVLLNAAGALSLDQNDWEFGLAEASESIDSGASLQMLESWIEKTNSYLS
jgi:anthranilate phosphoribosyltransferase